jgi:hypothetical protein
MSAIDHTSDYRQLPLVVTFHAAIVAANVAGYLRLMGF